MTERPTDDGNIALALAVEFDERIFEAMVSRHGVQAWNSWVNKINGKLTAATWMSGQHPPVCLYFKFNQDLRAKWPEADFTPVWFMADESKGQVQEGIPELMVVPVEEFELQARVTCMVDRPLPIDPDDDIPTQPRDHEIEDFTRATIAAADWLALDIYLFHQNYLSPSWVFYTAICEVCRHPEALVAEPLEKILRKALIELNDCPDLVSTAVDAVEEFYRNAGIEHQGLKTAIALHRLKFRIKEIDDSI